MKMWVVPDPMDYHRQGAYVVMAETADEARVIVEGHRQKDYENRAKGMTFDQYTGGRSPEWDRIEAVEGNVYINMGCDC